ncbi:MAG: macro domain-containing protein, partial [Armatimonadetes bacterium]|nr:macro domain-containing protein [Armatimonadota bacterium]
RGIIHVAALYLLWRSSERSVRLCVANALAVAREHGADSLAFPLIGAGTRSLPSTRVETIMVEAMKQADFDGSALLVRLPAGAGA